MIDGLSMLLALAVAAAPVPACAERLASFPYGAAPGSVGLKDAPGAERQGPRSFAVDARGRVLMVSGVGPRYPTPFQTVVA